MLLLPVTVTYTYTGVGQDRAGLYSRVQISFDFFWSRFVLTRRNTARALPPPRLLGGPAPFFLEIRIISYM